MTTQIYQSQLPTATVRESITLGGFRFKCERIVDGVPINPVLPSRFDDTPNDARPARSKAWWGVPFIVTYKSSEPGFVDHWKGNTRFDVRCLDGGAWDRSTVWGMFDTLEKAVALAQHKTPPWALGHGVIV